jgi:hypothetical protein
MTNIQDEITIEASALKTDAVSKEVVVKETYSAPEPLEYMGTDSSTVIEIAFVKPSIEDEMKEDFDSWMNFVKKPKFSKTKAIHDGIKLAASITAAANKALNFAARSFAEFAIIIGLICLRLKELNKDSETPWGEWAHQNLPFLGKRNREKYMAIAKRHDVHRLSFLGVDRMETICSATKNFEEKDAASKLLRKYNIAFDETSEVNLAEFKIMVDAALNCEKLSRERLAIEYRLALSLTRNGVSFDKAFVKKLKDISECGGDPLQYLNRLAMNSGKESEEGDPEKKIQDFNTLSSRLIKTVEFILGNTEQLEKLHRETFIDLLEKLLALQKVANFVDEE